MDNVLCKVEAERGAIQATGLEELMSRKGLDKGEDLVIGSRLLTLTKIISTGLGEDVRLNVVPGDGWRYNAESNEIVFPVEMLLTSSAEEVAGFSAHEAGHRQISRHNVRREVFARFFAKEYTRLLLNAFEDCRVDNWLTSIFGGVKHYLDAAYDDLLPPDITRSQGACELPGKLPTIQGEASCHPSHLYPHLEYLLGVRYYWKYGSLPSRLINPEAGEALERTYGDFEVIFSHYPRGRVSEREKFRIAEETALMIRDKILPAYEALVRVSVERLADAIKVGQFQITQKKCVSELTTEELEEEARKLLELSAKELADRLSPRTERPPARKREIPRRDTLTGKKTHEEAVPTSEGGTSPRLAAETLRELIKKQRRINREQETRKGEYERVYRLISNLVQSLSGVLENHFSKNKRPNFKGFFPSGQKPDLRRAMELSRKLSEGIPVQEKDLRVFLKRRLPSQRDHRIVLVLDESGSMDEPKRTSALAGLLLFMETLDTIGIDYAVIGFSDSPVIHKRFGGTLTPPDRRLLFEEVSLFIPSGSTADADALELATGILKEQPQDTLRWIIMVTDGEGNVNTTGKTFAELQEEALQEKIEVLGVGLGEEVTEVKNRYKSAIQVKEVEELPLVLSSVLEDKLIAQDVFWQSFLHPRHEGKDIPAEVDAPPVPNDVPELLASLYLYQKRKNPVFNVRHLKRASELFGFWVKEGHPEKEGFLKSLQYAFIDTEEQPEQVRELLLEKHADIARIFPDFKTQDLYLTFPRAEASISAIPQDLTAILDMLMMHTSHSALIQGLLLLKELVSSADNAYVSFPGMEACFRMIPDELVREITLEEIENKLDDKSWSVRQAAVVTLGRIYHILARQGDDAGLGVLEEKLRDEDPAVCRAAADALGRIWYYGCRRGKVTLKELEERLADPHWPVRQAAARALGKKYPALIVQGHAVDVAKLEERLLDKHWFVRQAEAEALGQIYPSLIKKGTQVDVHGLEERLKDKNVLVRQAAALALGRTYPALIKRGIDVNLGRLEERLDDDDWSVRQAAAQSMGRIWYHSFSQGKTTVKDLEKKLKASSWPVRQAAAHALGKIYPFLVRRGRKVNLSTLEERLRDADVDRSVCREAALALGIIWPHSYWRGMITFEDLEERLKDDNWFVHQAAAIALVGIYPALVRQGTDVDVGKLERRLKDKDWSIRQAAARAAIHIASFHISRNREEFGKVLASFNEMLARPMANTLAGTHANKVQVDEKTLHVGECSLERVSSHSGVPACVMTSSGYNILETLCFGYLLRHSVLLLGPTSTGKSFLIKWLAQVLGYEHLAYAINPYTSKFELIGGIKPDSMGRFVWQDGILLKAAQGGLWLVLEEINLASSEVVEILNDYLITGKITYSANGEQKEMYPHPDFRLFATGNPSSYSQRQKLSEVFLTRFKILYQKELSEEELTQILSSLFRISSALVLPIARFHTTMQNQADSRIIGKAEKDPYIFTLRDIIRLGKRVEPLLKEGMAEEEFLRRFFQEFFSVYIGRMRDDAEREAVISLLDAYFGFRGKGMDLDALLKPSSADLSALCEGLETSPGDVFIPQGEADIIPTPTQRLTLFLILKALLHSEPVLLVGNPASGKTTLVRYLARQKETDLYYVNLSSDAGLEELLGGYIQDENGTWYYRKGLLFKAITQGSWLLIDEANLSPLSEYLNTLLDFGYVVDGQENVCRAHPNFRLFLAINPPSVHQSRNLLSPALRSRFTEVWVEELAKVGELAGLIETWGNTSPTFMEAHEREQAQAQQVGDREHPDGEKKRKSAKKKDKEEFASDARFTHHSM